MKKLIGKVLSMLLVTALAASCLAGCTEGFIGNFSSTGEGETTSLTGEGETASLTGEGETAPPAGEGETLPQDGNFRKEGLPIVNEPVTLDVMTVRWPHMDDSFKNNQFLVDLETATNVKIDWQVKSNADWEEQKSILLASGELPSVILGDLSMFEEDILDNLEYFLPLDDYIDLYMPNYKKVMEENPYMKKYVTYPDGTIRSMGCKLPMRPVCSHQPVINKAWLDRLGLEVPTNTDELYHVLKEFLEKDANGNGDPGDEIPYTGKAVNALFDPTILILFGINEVNNKYMNVNNSVPEFFPVTQPFMEAIKMLHKWYEEGIMDQEYFTQSDDMMQAKYKSTPSRVGFCYSWTPDANFTTNKDEYIAIPPIAGPDGKKYAAGDPNGLSYRRTSLEITKFCKYPEVAARWADQFYTNEASIQNFWGAIGTVIKKNDDGTYELMDPPEGTNADLWYWNSSLRDFGPKYVSPDFESRIILPKSSGDGFKMEINKLGKDYVTEPYPSVLLTIEEREEMAMIKTDIEKYVQTASAQWITKGGVEEEWEGYVKRLKDMGLEQLVKIYTDAYQRFEGE